jgi:transcriptional regulator with XRE-family HTH domain
VNREQRLQSAFGKAVRRFRADAGVSQESLAGRAGLNRTYLGDVERGERNVSVVNMHKIAKALGIKLSALIVEMERYLGR